LADGFFKSINDNEAGQLLALAANASGVAGAALSIASGVISLFKESDTDMILSAIDQLRQDLEKDVAQLGDLINKQSQMILQNEDRLAVATAIGHSNTALDKLARVARTKDRADLEAADTESDIGVQFFLALPADPPDPFFLPGLSKAGSVRVLTIVAEDPDFRSRPEDVSQIADLSLRFASLIESVKQTVRASHTLTFGSEIFSFPITSGTAPGGPDTFDASVPYVVHFSHGVEVGTRNYIFSDNDLVDGELPLGYPPAHEQAEAVALAQSESDSGVSEELSFLAIPQFETILNSWRTT
jgi:hypothetical protein